MPFFLGDNSHKVNIFYKHIFYIVNDRKGHTCEFTKFDALQLKKDLGYMINNIGKSLDEFQEKRKVTLEYMLNNHRHFRTELGFKKI